MRKISPKTIIIVIVAAILVIGGGVYWYQASKETESLIEEDDAQQYDTANWQIYENKDLGYKIKYPQDWVFEEFENNTTFFGTPESKIGGYIWKVAAYEPDELEEQISDMGKQFDDRKETRKDVRVNQDITGLLVTVTTERYEDWISKIVYFERDGQLYAIGNGAIDDERFDAFYKSYEVLSE